jgi:hypothetical protein
VLPAVCLGGTVVQKPPQEVPQKPDLQANIKLETKKYTNTKGVVCYSLQPIYTVTNKGMSTAKKFRVKLAWKWPNKPNWQDCSFSPNNTLSPTKSRTWGPSAAEEIHWCQGDKKKAGFRVTADDQDVVTEKKEDNNTATVMFPKFVVK